MNRIRIVHIDNLDVGLKVHLGNYLRYLTAQGYDVSAACHPGRWIKNDTVIQDGVPVRVFQFEPRISPLADMRTIAGLVRYFLHERFDVVHTHTAKVGLLGRLAARLAGVPIIVHTLHGLYLNADLMSPLQYRFFVMIAKLGSASCHSILSQNREDIETAVREGICAPEKIRYLGNGIDLNRFYPGCVPADKLLALRAELGIRPRDPVVSFVGRLVREKGIHEFIEAAGILRSRGVRAKYLIVGTPQEGKRSSVSVEKLARKHGVKEDALLLGYREDIPQLLSITNVVALPSYGIEGLPRILMEAAAMGIPSVATRARGNTEAIDHGETGLLVPMRNAQALAETISRLLRNHDLAAEIGHCARQRALRQFDERLFFLETDAEYRRLIKKRLAVDPERLLRPIPRPMTQASS